MRANANPDIKVFLIGNKADLEASRLITTEQGQQLQKDFDFDLFFETSAKTGLNTEELFVEAAKMLYKNYIKFKQRPKKIGDKLKFDNNKNNSENKKGCCK